MALYFAYGSNQDEKQMKGRCPCSSIVGKAVLKDYKLAYTFFSTKGQCGCADIIKSEGDEVWGLLHKLNSDDLERLDGYEGHPTGYRRFTTVVLDEFGKEIEAEVYEVVEKSGEHVEPSRWYHDILLNAAKKYNFPDSYKKFLNSFKVLN
ncbi:MAG: gamma-glutamylcyclotransferase family protein [Candidatus Paceibacterota bacterium]|jgi:gamma-glutamylcyclotransferase (GGCT)/AIG2-like uncharacterized protein YtfP